LLKSYSATLQGTSDLGTSDLGTGNIGSGNREHRIWEQGTSDLGTVRSEGVSGFKNVLTVMRSAIEFLWDQLLNEGELSIKGRRNKVNDLILRDIKKIQL
jgi:hypothetical protein